MIASLAGVSALAAETYRVPLFVTDTNFGQTGVLRLHNRSDESGEVLVYVVDNAGARSDSVSLSLAANAAVELDAAELNARGLGAINGHVRLEVTTTLDVDVLAYLRSADGSFSALHGRVRGSSAGGVNDYRVPFFGAARDATRAGRLRITNASDTPAAVMIEGIDDNGAAAVDGVVEIGLTAGATRVLSAQELEAGADGIAGQFGAGAGEWRLKVTSDQPLGVVSYIESPLGRLDNLSSAGTDGLAAGDHAAFGGRLSGADIELDDGNGARRIAFMPGDVFSETARPPGTADTRVGRYAYARTGADAGRLTLAYADGGDCELNLHHSSRISGWYAWRCEEANGDIWRGGHWSVREAPRPEPAPEPEPLPEPSAPKFPDGAAPDDQNYILGEAIAPLTLPAADGGNGEIGYALEPLPPGLAFDAATRELAGAPGEAGVHRVRYSAHDTDGDADSLAFLIMARAPGSSDCLVGEPVRPGGRCTYPGSDQAFTVNADGRARFLALSSANAINIVNRRYRGRFYDFRAMHIDEGTWRIERLEGVEGPPANAVPRLPHSGLPGNLTFVAQAPVETLVLPAATGGDGVLAHSLLPTVPGMSFDAPSRTFSGTPSEPGVYRMRYLVADRDGDSDQFSFAITVIEPAMSAVRAVRAETRHVPLFVANTGFGQVGVLRLHNRSDEPGEVLVRMVDNTGARSDPVSLSLAARAAVELDAAELRARGLGAINGRVRLEVSTALDVDVLVYLRSADGSLSALHDRVRGSADGGIHEYRVPFFGAARDPARAGRLQLVNAGDASAAVTIEGIDDNGAAAVDGVVEINLAAGTARVLSAQDLEVGADGITGRFGAGEGVWRLMIASDQPLDVVSFIESRVGRLDNLSSTGMDGFAPQDHAAFGGRLSGAKIALDDGNGERRIAIAPGDAFSETLTGAADARAGRYAYARTGTDAGRLTLAYDENGGDCELNLHHSSRASGWYAWRCDETDGDVWRGGRWSVREAPMPEPTSEPLPEPSAPRFPDDAAPKDQHFILGEAVTPMTLPAAEGGNGEISYALEPLPLGLALDATTRELTGAPEEAGVHRVRYTAHDADGDADSLAFLIMVRAPGSSDCLAGEPVRPGGRCTYPGSDQAFAVNADGRARFLALSSANAINVVNRRYRGRFYDFQVVHIGGGTWRIERLEGIEGPPADTAPRLPDSGLPGNLTFVADAEASALALPAATGGDGALAYSLEPKVPGMSFDMPSRTLSGTPSAPGVYRMRYLVADQDGDSDQFSFAITVLEPRRRPDLIVESAALSSTSLIVEQSFTLQVSVRNKGNAESAATTLRYYRSPDAIITATDTELETEGLGALPPAAAGSWSINLTAPAAGSYYYGACVDTVKDESAVANNCSAGVRVTVSEPPPQPDLVIDPPSATGSALNPGDGFTLSAVVRNRGRDRSATTTLRYYRSHDATITVADDEIGTGSVTSLAAAATSLVSIDLTAPAAGTYYYGICVDAVADESNRANNCSASVAVTIAGPPDLVVSSFSASSRNLEPGAPFTLSVTVRNRGGSRSAATTLRYYRSPDSTITTVDTGVGTISVTNLSAASSSRESIDLTAPAAGTYYYGACIDAIANEADLANNCSAGVAVTVTAPPTPPDLVVDSPSVTRQSLQPGDHFTLSAVVRNRGQNTSSATTLRYYRSSNAAITTTDIQVGTDGVARLAAAAKSNESIDLTAPATGTYYYGACVDTITDESNTTNNCSAGVRVTVNNPPDLVVSSSTLSSQSLTPGASFTLSATVSNQGGVGSDATTLRYYRSSDASISGADTGIGTDSVAELSTGATSGESINLTAPGVGTYYFGACVDAVADESDTANNCSVGVLLTVTGQPDLVVSSILANSQSVAPGGTFTLNGTVRNSGLAISAVTTLRYYQSLDATISNADTGVGTDSIPARSPAATSTFSATITAPSSEGTYYFGACVDAVAGETNTANNCSASVQVTVMTPSNTQTNTSTTTDTTFDIEIVYGSSVPSRVKAGTASAVSFWESAITGDLPNVDFSARSTNNSCTGNTDFDGEVDDIRIFVSYQNLDGVGGSIGAAAYCGARSRSGLPILGYVEVDSSDLSRLVFDSGTGQTSYLWHTARIRILMIHEIAHALGFGTAWSGLKNSAIRHGARLGPPPDTHWPGTNAVAAFNAAGGSNYSRGKVPVENERGGRGSLDSHWRHQAMHGEIMTYQFNTSAAISAITIQSMADLGYSVDVSVADAFDLSNRFLTSASPTSSIREGSAICKAESHEVEFFPDVEETRGLDAPRRGNAVDSRPTHEHH